jgi:hypothetical protein
LSTHLHLGLPSGLFPSGFPTIILYSPHSCYMPCPSLHPCNYKYKIHKSIFGHSLLTFKIYDKTKAGYKHRTKMYKRLKCKQIQFPTYQ